MPPGERRTLIRGVELAHHEVREAGDDGPSALLIHETGTDSRAWGRVAAELAGSAPVVTYDRRGWGRSGVPEDYRRTTIEEQSEDAAELLSSLGAAPAVLCGAGLGAVIALDLAARRPERVAGLVLVEPHLPALAPEATELLSADGAVLQAAASEGGRERALEVYLSGGLQVLGAGVERLPAELTAPARERPVSVFAELGAASAWATPFSRLGRLTVEASVVCSEAAPALIRRIAAALAQMLGLTGPRELPGAGPAHAEAPSAIAGVIGMLRRQTR